VNSSGITDKDTAKRFLNYKLVVVVGAEDMCKKIDLGSF
jgi:hypothetical protein